MNEQDLCETNLALRALWRAIVGDEPYPGDDDDYPMWAIVAELESRVRSMQIEIDGLAAEARQLAIG